MKWFARRFKHTRELERERRLLRRQLTARQDSEIVLTTLFDIVDDQRVQWGKMELKEVEVVLTALVEYRRALHFIGCPDPILSTVFPIFEKYNIKVDTPSWNPNSPQYSR
jgi:hypothetical protein